MACRFCNSEDCKTEWITNGHEGFELTSKVCRSCEEISIQRYNINTEWKFYEGRAAPETELPQYPKAK